MQTNEELARRIKEGERELLPELWEGVRRYIYAVAYKWWRAWRDNRPGLDVNDVVHRGCIALYESITDYDPERGAFLSWLHYLLLTAFCVELGCRTPAQLKRPENQAISLSLPAGDESEDITLEDMLEDPEAENAFNDVEEDVYQYQAAEVVKQALCELSERQQEVIWGKYYEGKTLSEISEVIGISISAVQQHERKAYRILQKNPSIRELHHGDRNLFRHTGYTAWKNTGCSVQEWELLWKERHS